WGAVRQAANRRNGVAVVAAGRSAMVRNGAPTYGLYGADSARAYDNPAPAQPYDDRQPSQSYTAQTPPPYPAQSYYGGGAPPPTYDREPPGYPSPYTARQRSLYYDRETGQWGYAPATQAGEPSNSPFGPNYRVSGAR